MSIQGNINALLGVAAAAATSNPVLREKQKEKAALETAQKDLKKSNTAVENTRGALQEQADKLSDAQSAYKEGKITKVELKNIYDKYNTLSELSSEKKEELADKLKDNMSLSPEQSKAAIDKYADIRSQEQQEQAQNKRFKRAISAAKSPYDIDKSRLARGRAGQIANAKKEQYTVYKNMLLQRKIEPNEMRGIM